jgi:hypothetical protein
VAKAGSLFPLKLMAYSIQSYLKIKIKNVGLYGLLLIFVKLSLTFGMPQSQTLAASGSRAAAASVFQYAGYISKKLRISFRTKLFCGLPVYFWARGRVQYLPTPLFFSPKKARNCSVT